MKSGTGARPHPPRASPRWRRPRRPACSRRERQDDDAREAAALAERHVGVQPVTHHQRAAHVHVVAPLEQLQRERARLPRVHLGRDPGRDVSTAASMNCASASCPPAASAANWVGGDATSRPAGSPPTRYASLAYVNGAAPRSPRRRRRLGRAPPSPAPLSPPRPLNTPGGPPPIGGQSLSSSTTPNWNQPQTPSCRTCASSGRPPPRTPRRRSPPSPP